MPIDREATLKQADKLLKQGKVDAAIAAYVRLIDEQPQDWTTINALGDLYLRAGNNDKAIEQYIRVADHQFAEGFFPKSAALYKKALKLAPENEHILMQLAEIGERQGTGGGFGRNNLRSTGAREIVCRAACSPSTFAHERELLSHLTADEKRVLAKILDKLAPIE